MRAYALLLLIDWQECILDTDKQSVEEWHVEYKEKLDLYEGNTELMAALKKQMKGEWWKWKTSRTSVLVDMEPNDPKLPTCDELIKDMMTYDNQELFKYRLKPKDKVAGKIPGKHRAGKRHREKKEEDTPGQGIQDCCRRNGGLVQG